MPGVEPLRLFIAEDNVDFANFLSTAATREGWQVVVCGNGKILLDALDKNHGPALLLVDVNMPNMDGIEVVGEVSALARPFRIRFMTGGQMPSIVAASMIAKARDLSVGQSIFKPLPLARFQEILREEARELAKLDPSSV